VIKVRAGLARFQFVDGATQGSKATVYLCLRGKIGSHIPQINARPLGTMKRFFSANDRRIVVDAQKQIAKATIAALEF
jgi:hypothetical protein